MGGSRAGTAALVAVAALTGIACAAGGLAVGLEADTCTVACDYAPVAGGVALGVAGPLTVALAACLGVLARRERGRSSWWLPVVGGVAEVVLLPVADAIARTGVR